MKKIIGLLLSVILLFVFIACDEGIPVGGVDTEWYNDTDRSFSLRTAAELAGLSELVENGEDFDGRTITLLENIDLNGISWKPIGTEETPFKGIIQSENGITISNLSIASEIQSTIADGQHVAGFIGFLGGGGVKNITFADARISVGEDVAAAVVAGFMNGGVVEEVTVNNADIRGGWNSDMGAIAGKLYDSGSITDCVVTGTSIILDAGNRTYSGCNIGGIVGSFSHEGEETEKTISGNEVDLSGNPEAEFAIMNYMEEEGMSLPVGGIIGQIGGNTNGKVSGNTLVLADADQIAKGNGGIVTGYSQEFYGYSANKGSCGDKTWENEFNYDSPLVSEKLR